MQEQNEEEIRHQGNFPHWSKNVSELERLRQPLGGGDCGVMMQSRFQQLSGSLIDNSEVISLKAGEKHSSLFTLSAEPSCYKTVRNINKINLRKKGKNIQSIKAYSKI